MTIKAMKEQMRNLYNIGDNQEAYGELWKAIQTLNNLGLLDKKYVDALVKEDHRLFEES